MHIRSREHRSVGDQDMDIRKRILYLVVFFFHVHHLTTVSIATKEINEDVLRERWIQQQNDGTLDICSDILETKQKNETNQKQSPCQRPLTVWVPKKTDFIEFVDVNKDGELKGGFSIAIFCLALRELPFKIQPVFIPFVDETHKSVGYYDELVQQIKDKECEAVAGDITISANRTKYVDFTIPYMSTEVYILVRAAQDYTQTLLTLLRPFSKRLWLTIIGAQIFTGFAIGYLEYRVGNPEFKVPFYKQLLTIIWFPISTFFFHEGRILNKCSKFVLVVWLTMVFIVIQIFTACLSSWLTVNQLQARLPNHYHEVGYQYGSVVRDLAVDRQICPTIIDHLQPLSSMADYKNALDNGTVDAIFDELPFVDIFLATYGDNYMKIGPLAEEPGFGFAFPRESPLQQEFSRAIVKVTESPEMARMKKKYLGILNPPQTQPSQTTSQQSLDVPSFTLLFVFMGLATVMAIICSEISLMRKPHQILPVISMHNTSPVQTTSANSIQLLVVDNEHAVAERETLQPHDGHVDI